MKRFSTLNWIVKFYSREYSTKGCLPSFCVAAKSFVYLTFPATWFQFWWNSRMILSQTLFSKPMTAWFRISALLSQNQPLNLLSCLKDVLLCRGSAAMTYISGMTMLRWKEPRSFFRMPSPTRFRQLSVSKVLFIASLRLIFTCLLKWNLTFHFRKFSI